MNVKAPKLIGIVAVFLALAFLMGGCALVIRSITVDFTATPTVGAAALTVKFTALVTVDPARAPYSVEWDFGDGTTSTKHDPVHVYKQPGFYTVTLTVTAGHGNLQQTVTETKADYIKVASPGGYVPPPPTGTGSAADINAAIDNAGPGGLVLVGAGEYVGDVNIDQPGVTIRPASRPVIDGNVLVSAPGVTIQGFDITGYLGITQDGADVTVLDCTYKARQLTADPHHDRNSSVFKASDGTLWVFFARGRSEPAPPDPDDDKVSAGGGYDIAYLKSTDGGASWTEGTLPAIPDLGTSHGAIWPAAFEDSSGKIWVFYTILGSNADVYYFTSSDGGVTWTGPTATGIKDKAPVTNHHMDAMLAKDGTIWVILSMGVGGTDAVWAFTSADGGTTWTGPTRVSDPSLGWTATPRIVQDDSAIRVIYFGPSGVYISSSTDNGASWVHTFVAASGGVDYDPALAKLGGTYYVFWAPATGISTPVNWHQWIEKTTSTDLTTWSTPAQVTTGCNSDCSIKWWDYWVEPFVSDGDLYLFHSSLRNSSGTDWTDSNLWLIMNP